MGALLNAPNLLRRGCLGGGAVAPPPQAGSGADYGGAKAPLSYGSQTREMGAEVAREGPARLSKGLLALVSSRAVQDSAGFHFFANSH